VATAERLQAQLRESERELALLQKAAAGGLAETLVAGAGSVGDVRIVAEIVSGEVDADRLRALTDDVLDRLKSGVVVLGAASGGRALLAAKVSADLVARGSDAGKIVREASAVVGGRGGGKPQSAMGGGSDPSKLPEAIETARTIIAGAGG
jgi:alanyl-tRNA synthetase